MIPIRDTIRSANYPVINNTLILINISVFLYQSSIGRPELESIQYVYGLIPARYSVSEIAGHFTFNQQIISLFSYMFLHGGLFHLIGNMWTLYIFGDNVEDNLGHFRYLLFYVLCGFGSGLSHLLTNLYSTIPTIGASGAIAGIMGAYFILHPNSKILTLIPIIFIPYFVEIPAFIYLGIWFLFQLLSATGSQGEFSGIAWWAHIGGFVFGILLLYLIIKVPEEGTIHKIRTRTKRKRSPRLQVIRPVGPGSDPHLYGIINISSIEAIEGTLKLVNIPWGFHDRLFKVSIPSGVKDGAKLQLTGQGKITSNGERGNLYLKVKILNK